MIEITHRLRFSLVSLLLITLTACGNPSPASAKGNTAMNKIEQLFTHTKEVCFGRYVLTVPAEAEIAYGENRINSQPSVIYRNQAKDIQSIANARLQRMKSGIQSWRSPIIHRTGQGPLPNSLQLWYSENEIRLEHGQYWLVFYVVKGNDVYQFSGGYIDRNAKGLGDGGRREYDAQNIPRTEKEAWDKLLPFVNAMRPRADDEIPTEPGFCVPGAFMPDNTYKYREQSEMGIRLPSLPDVSFSISSQNYGSLEGKNGANLMELLKDAQQEQGSNYGFNILRKGRSPLQTWYKGQELLSKQKKTGHHDFIWMSVGEDGSVANPNEIEVRMYSKVDADTVGLAKESSVTDDEAIALWDKLLKGFRFRVPIQAAFQSSVGVGAPCPQTGMWYCEGVSPEQGIYMRKGDPMPGQSYNKEARANMQWHLIKPMGDDT